MKLAGVLLILAGALGMLLCVGQRGGLDALTVPFAVVMLAGIAMRVGDRDILGDPDDARDRLREMIEEERRHRGEAGWQKPVKPTQQDRPGGLPPRDK